MGKPFEDIDLVGLFHDGRVHAAIHQQCRHETGQGQEERNQRRDPAGSTTDGELDGRSPSPARGAMYPPRYGGVRPADIRLRKIHTAPAATAAQPPTRI